VFDWITHWFISWGPQVEQKIIDMVHWAVHAVASVLIAVFDHVLSAWKFLIYGLGFLGYEEIHFAEAVWGFAYRVVWVYIPRLLRWAWTWIGFLHKLIWTIFGDLVRALDTLRRLAWSWILTLWRNVLRFVWDPLKRYADLIWHDLLKWGWTAWWWITHPESLAGFLFWHIIRWLEFFAWEAGKQLGTFGLSLVRHNLRRFLILIEDIVSAVL
jgi:hypothetical protein